MSTACIQIPSRGRISNPASPDTRSLNTRFVVTVWAISSLGLGNIWRVPFLVTRHGGGAFLLVYLAALILLAFPILIAELMVGRRGRVSPECFGNVAQDEGRTFRWSFSGVIYSLAGVLLISAYAEAIGSDITAVTPASHAPGSLTELGISAVFLWAAAAIAARDLRWGLRPLHTRLLPIVLLLLAGLLVYSWSATEQPGQTLLHAVRPDFSRLGWDGVFDACRLALLTLGVGLGMGVSYGTVIHDSVPILRVSLLVLLATTGLVLVAGIGALPLPVSAARRGLLLLSGFAAAVAILYPVVEHATNWTGLSRRNASYLVATVAWATAAALEIAGGTHSTKWLESLGVNVFIPAAALCGVLFAGWAMSRRSCRMELGLRPAQLFVVWRWLIRYPVPLILFAMVLSGLFQAAR